jgi:hypothetical protein
MTRQFQFPSVRELLPTQGTAHPAPHERPAPVSQRDRVAASLLVCPREVGSAPPAR